MSQTDPASLALLLAALTLMPLLFIVTTCFLKLSIVMMLVRNALGVQQAPPNIAIYGLALVLSMYVMSPVFSRMAEVAQEDGSSFRDVRSALKTSAKAAEPLRQFMLRHSRPEQRAFFVDSVKKLWPPEHAAAVTQSDYLVLMPAFVVGELTAAFEAGFLLYLPFIIIDLLVSNILLALGMMMVSPTTISLPLKLFLFVMVDGWTRLIHGLVLSYG